MEEVLALSTETGCKRGVDVSGNADALLVRFSAVQADRPIEKDRN
jgi:hypothetical protein